MRTQTCCFTGHRPEKMNLNETEVKRLLNNAIVHAVNSGYTRFITGMAPGTDMWAAEIVLEIKRTNGNINLICALPHPNFDRKLDENDKRKFATILEAANSVELINSHYFRGCYNIRNNWMVDHSSLVISAYNGSSGGTRNTLNYAARQGIKVINVLNIE